LLHEIFGGFKFYPGIVTDIFPFLVRIITIPQKFLIGPDGKIVAEKIPFL